MFLIWQFLFKFICALSVIKIKSQWIFAEIAKLLLQLHENTKYLESHRNLEEKSCPNWSQDFYRFKVIETNKIRTTEKNY